MDKQKTRYIVKRSYATSRTGTDAFVKLIKKNEKINESVKQTEKNNNIERIKYNIDNEEKVCYTENSFRESCVIPTNSKEE